MRQSLKIWLDNSATTKSNSLERTPTMIPVLQFDPASQSLWYDPYLINRSRGAPEIGRALELAIIGDDPSLKSHVNNINDTWIQTRAVNIASAIWHEKRHFVDFMLTNY